MIIDRLLEFSDAQALTATAASTNVIDLGSDAEIGPGRPLWVVITIDVELDGTTPTFQAALQTDDNDSFSSPTVIAESEQFSALAAGDKIVIGVPYSNERYLRLNYTLGGTTPTVSVSAHLTDQEPGFWKAYPDAV